MPAIAFEQKGCLRPCLTATANSGHINPFTASWDHMPPHMVSAVQIIPGPTLPTRRHASSYSAGLEAVLARLRHWSDLSREDQDNGTMKKEIARSMHRRAAVRAARSSPFERHLHGRWRYCRALR